MTEKLRYKSALHATHSKDVADRMCNEVEKRCIGQEILDGIREIKAGGGKRYRLQPLSKKARNIVNKIKFIDNKKEVK